MWKSERRTQQACMRVAKTACLHLHHDALRSMRQSGVCNMGDSLQALQAKVKQLQAECSKLTQEAVHFRAGKSSPGKLAAGARLVDKENVIASQ